jgi:tetratricopeptide (TPR) repeat protein
VLLTTGLPVDRAISIVQRLRAIGALLIPGETAAPIAAGSAPPPEARPAPSPSRTSGPIPQIHAPTRPPASPAHEAAAPARPVAAAASGPIRRVNSPPPAEPAEPEPEHDLALPGTTPVELAALREAVALDDRIRRRILAMARLADGRDPFALLGVPAGADPRRLKRAYFKLSKEIHPDRYFGQRLGTFTDRLPAVFEAMSRAYARLTSPERSRGAADPGRAEQPQTPQEYAAELFDRACQLEIGGEPLEAMKLFAAAVRVDPQPRFLRRAASCALAARQPRSAVEYAKKAHSLAPNDPSAARLLAAAFRAAGKLSDAEEVLVMAMALKSENDTLAAELRHDLAEVRRLLAQS